jgi:hypothetical protein
MEVQPPGCHKIRSWDDKILRIFIANQHGKNENKQEVEPITS